MGECLVLAAGVGKRLRTRRGIEGTSDAGRKSFRVSVFSGRFLAIGRDGSEVEADPVVLFFSPCEDVASAVPRPAKPSRIQESLPAM